MKYNHMIRSDRDMEGTFVLLKNGLEIKINSSIGNRIPRHKFSMISYSVDNITITYDAIYKKYKFIEDKFRKKTEHNFKDLKVQKIIIRRIRKLVKLKRKETSYEHI